jgi:signal transduction histidine kinase
MTEIFWFKNQAEGNVAVNIHNKGVPSGAEDVIADPFFRRVLYCLLSNAVKFSPKNGVVDVTLSYTANLSPVPSKGILYACIH